MVYGPHGLEVVLHLLFQRLRHGVHRCELLQVAPLGVVLLLSAVHPLQLVGHVAEDGGMHQGPDHHDHDGEDLLVLGVGGHVAKADGGEGSAGEVQGGDVGVAVLLKKSIIGLKVTLLCKAKLNHTSQLHQRIPNTSALLIQHC